jgi:hypothetical protein
MQVLQKWQQQEGQTVTGNHRRQHKTHQHPDASPRWDHNLQLPQCLQISCTHQRHSTALRLDDKQTPRRQVPKNVRTEGPTPVPPQTLSKQHWFF